MANRNLETSASVDSLDKFKTPDGVVKRWMMEIDLASSDEAEWRKDAMEAIQRFRGKSTNRMKDFNVLYANTEIMAGALLDETPRPTVRPRYSTSDERSKTAATILERSLNHQVEECNLYDTELPELVEDYLLAGRCVPRVRYLPITAPQTDADGVDMIDPETNEPMVELVGQNVAIEGVQWEDFRHGPGRRWKEVPWIAYRHKVTKDEAKEQFPEAAEEIEKAQFGWEPDLSAGGSQKGKDGTPDVIPEIMKRIVIWEIWCKREREVIWVCETVKDKPLDVEPDPMNLRNFYPTPRPAVAIKDPDQLTPTTLFSQYKTQADQVRELQQRIDRLTKSLKAVGIYDSTISEMKNLMEARDGQLVPTQASGALAERGGLTSAVWFMPIREIADVLSSLYSARAEAIREIYEITGISDILRGASNPNETLGAQQIKAAVGGQRFGRHKAEVQRIVRDCVQIMAEIISEKFDPNILARMTDTQVEDVQAVQELLRDDITRSFMVDVETEATTAEEMARDKGAISELVSAIVDLLTNLGPAVVQGSIPAEFVTKIIAAATHKFRLGREVDDALDSLEEHLKNKLESGEAAQGVPEEEVRQMVEQAMEQGKEEGKNQSQIEIATIKADTDLKLAALKRDSDVLTAVLTAKQREMEAKERERGQIERHRETLDQEAVIHDDNVSLRREEIDIQREKVEIDAKKVSMSDKRTAASDDGATSDDD